MDQTPIQAVKENAHHGIILGNGGGSIGTATFKVTSNAVPGKTYDATVVLEDDGQYANFKLEFDQQKGGKR